MIHMKPPLTHLNQAKHKEARMEGTTEEQVAWYMDAKEKLGVKYLLPWPRRRNYPNHEARHVRAQRKITLIMTARIAQMEFCL